MHDSKGTSEGSNEETPVYTETRHAETQRRPSSKLKVQYVQFGGI